MTNSLHRLVCVGALLVVSVASAVNPGLGEPPPSVGRRTPLDTVDGFLNHVHAGDYEGAAHYLNLSGVPETEQRTRGAQLAKRLKFVLDRKLWFDYSKLSDDPGGHPEDGAQTEHLGDIDLAKGVKAIRLQRVPLQGDQHGWVFSADTVRAIDALYERHAGPLAERLPEFLFVRSIWVLELWQWIGGLLLIFAALGIGFVLERLALSAAGRVAKLTPFRWDDQVIAAARGPLRWVFFSVSFSLGTRALALPPPAQNGSDLIARSLVIAVAAWFCVRFFRLLATYINEKVANESPENVGRVRGMQTQITVLRHVLEVAVVLVACALVLMQFEVVRSVGVSLLASAGLAGLVIGLAAQKSISTLLAGIQLSITQPIRIGDTVIVENEWGWIEEVTLTYVVVKVWDLRRLVIPMTYFLERPFQNWSKVAPEILGTIEIRADYTADVDAFRAELKRILENEGKALWNGKAQGVQVTDCTDRVMTIRALISAADSGKQWELRCLVREKFLAFLRENPQWLPVTRNETRVVPTHEEKVDPMAPFTPAESKRNELKR